jgi:hypothetical protein
MTLKSSKGFKNEIKNLVKKNGLFQITFKKLNNDNIINLIYFFLY